MRKIIFILISGFLLMPSPVSAQGAAPNWAWVRGYQGDLHFTKMAITSQGDMILAGSCTDTVAVGNDTLRGGIGHSSFLMKMNMNQEVIWKKTFDTYPSGGFTMLRLDADGNIVLCGNTSGGSIDSIQLAAAGGQDVMVLKFDANGNLLWSKTAGGSNEDYPNFQSSMDAMGNIYINGRFQYRAYFGTDTLRSAYNQSVNSFVVKYDKNGNQQWVRQTSSPEANMGTAIEADDYGNVYSAGQFLNSVTFDGHTVHTQITPNLSSMYLCKYDSAGNVIWLKTYEGTQWAHDMMFNKDGELIITGQLTGNAALGSSVLTGGTQSRFTAKFDTSGNAIWGVGSVQELIYGGAMTQDENRNIYIAHDFSSNFNVNSGVGIIEQFDVDGAKLWTKQQVDNIGINAICFFNNEIYIAGEYGSYNKSNFPAPFTLSKRGGFIAKLSYITSIHEPDAQPQLTISPNPAKDILQLRFSENSFQRIILRSLTGAVVKQWNVEAGKGEMSLSLEDIADGAYLLQLSGVNESVARKVILSR